MQVQQTLRQSSERRVYNGGVNLNNPSKSLDGTEGLQFNRSQSKINDYGNHYVQGIPRRVSATSTPRRDLSQRRFHQNAHHQGSLYKSNAGTNSPQPSIISEGFRGTPTHTNMLLPGSFRFRSVKHSVGLKHPPASTVTQRSLRDCSQRQSVVNKNKQTAQQSFYRSTQLDGGSTLNAQMSPRHFVHRPEMNMKVESKLEMKNQIITEKNSQYPEMNLEEALRCLDKTDEGTLIHAVRCIQNKCSQDDENKNVVFDCNGVRKLVQLLKSDDENIQCTVAGALRNVVYLNSTNKNEVKNNDGLVIIIDVLKETRYKETICQLAGLLWNLSSDDSIKRLFSKEALGTITKSILVPGSGMNEEENPKDKMNVDPKAFYLATGCLRNLSSATDTVRTNMRNCENLIDSLVYFPQTATGSDETTGDEKSVENCVCILRNLTYEAEKEFPPQVSEQQKETQDTAPRKTVVCCFPHSRAKQAKDAKDRTDGGNEVLLREIKDPHGADLLWSKPVIRMYLSLMARNKRNETREAAIGALQNLTHGKGKISVLVAKTIAEANTLQELKQVLKNINLKMAALDLIANLSNFTDLCETIAEQLLPGVFKMLPSWNIDKNESDEVKILCGILQNLSLSDVDRAKRIKNNGCVKRMLRIKNTSEAEVAINNLKAVLDE